VQGFCLAFLTQLDRSSHPVVEKLICEHVIGKSNIKSLLKQPIPAPPGGKHVKFEGYWVASGDMECVVPDGYVLTPLVRSNLRDLTRVVSAGYVKINTFTDFLSEVTSLIKTIQV